MPVYDVQVTGEHYVQVEAEDRDDAVQQAFEAIEAGNSYFKFRDVDVTEG